ncbi:MAG: hypothetical protein AAFO63_13865, partial [Pseudomonadota bacterium]
LFLAASCSGGGGGGGGDGGLIPSPPPPPPPPPERRAQDIVFSGSNGAPGTDAQELFVIQDNGMGLTRLSAAPFSSDVEITDFAIQPFGDLVAYTSDTDGPGGDRLFVARINGTLLREITPVNKSTDTVFSFDWAPGGQLLALQANFDSSDGAHTSIYTVQITGRNLIRVNTDGEAQGSEPRLPQWSSNQVDIASTVADFNPNSRVSDETTRILNVTDVSTNTFFHRVEAGGRLDEVRWSPDGEKLCYNFDDTAGRRGGNEIAVSILANGTGDNTILSATETRSVGPCIWSADSTKVAYVEDRRISGPSQLVTRVADASEPAEVIVDFLAQSPARELEIRTFAFAPNSNDRLAFITREASDPSTQELYRVRAGSLPIKLNPTLAAGEYVTEFVWSPDGSKVAFIATQNEDGFGRVFVANEDGTGQTEITLMAPGDEAGNIAWSPDSAKLVFLAGMRTTNGVDVDQLYTADLETLRAEAIATGVSSFEDVAYDERPEGYIAQGGAGFTPPVAGQPTSFTLNSIIVQDFADLRPNNVSTWDEPFLGGGTEPDLAVQWRRQGALAEVYFSDTKDNADRGTIYTFTEPSDPRVYPPLPQTFDYNTAWELTLFDIDFGGQEIMNDQIFTPSEAYELANFGTNPVRIFAGDYIYELDIDWNF